MTKKTGIELIVDERSEQLQKHNRSVESDIKINDLHQLRSAAHTLIIFPELHNSVSILNAGITQQKT